MYRSQETATWTRQSGKLHPILVGLALLVAWSAGCKESADDFSSEIVCNEYCSKSYDCDEVEPTSEQTADCVAECRNSIEDNCGNDVQAEANSRIADCVDLSCDDFWECMVFEPAPECFDFVSN